MADDAVKKRSRDDRVSAAMQEMEQIHAEYLQKMNELQARQRDLMKRVLERIDAEKAAEIESKLKGGV